MAYVPTSLTAPDGEAAPRRRIGGLLLSRSVVAPLAAVIVFVCIWEAAVWINGWPDYLMASPSDLPAAYIRFWDLFLVMGWQTLWRTVVGLLLAVAVGSALFAVRWRRSHTEVAA